MNSNLVYPKTFRFDILYKSKKSKARVGRITTPHGVIDTPNFVGVGTNATMKAMDSQMIKDIGMQLMFCNTYHLILQPGVDVIADAGGLHKFMNRDMPIITDSGGFQVFSLAYGSVADELKKRGRKSDRNMVLKIDENGVVFRSYRDGRRVTLTPESSVQAQKKLGADIIIPFDELPPYHMRYEDLRRSFDRTHRWEKRSLAEHLKDRGSQAMYAVCHGGLSYELRKESAETLSNLEFDGFAIGGSFGRNKDDMIPMLRGVMPFFDDRPIHLLGIGDISSLRESLGLGIDTFDSSYPTKAARHGLLFSKDGNINITKGENSIRHVPVDGECRCFTCRNYKVAYLHHLFKARELIFYTLASIHNLHFMIDLMRKLREGIISGDI